MKTFFTLLLVSITSVSLLSQTSYVWTGSVNSSFSTAANWSPARQVGLTSDIMIFETGTNVNVSNVNQVTIGQLIIRNNTSLSLSPAAGNSKTIFINGGTGDDFVIESGSGLTITGNDPQLNIVVKTGATASIQGSLVFTGEINHTINAIDSLAIRFKQGSMLSQSCPGNIFTNAGIKDAIVFESGSELRINHINALSPFGLSSPASKVKFESNSLFTVAANNQNVISLSGRNYGNVTLTGSSNLTVTENMTQPVTIGDLSITSGSSLAIVNQNPASVSAACIKGDLNIDGYLNLSDTSAGIKNLELNFTGNVNHTISGNGETSFAGLNKIVFTDNVNLNRDLVIECAVVTYSRIIRNSHNLTVRGKFVDLSVFAGSVGKSGEDVTATETASNNNMPKSFSVSQNYPNPFNPNTKIDYTIAKDSKVSIKVFDITGKEVATLAEGTQASGTYSVNFNASNLSSGIYFYRISAEANGIKWSETKKMILTK